MLSIELQKQNEKRNRTGERHLEVEIRRGPRLPADPKEMTLNELL